MAYIFIELYVWTSILYGVIHLSVYIYIYSKVILFRVKIDDVTYCCTDSESELLELEFWDIDLQELLNISGGLLPKAISDVCKGH